MNQNLYAPETNDRGWYRVNRENKKLKREIGRLYKVLEKTLYLLKRYSYSEALVMVGDAIERKNLKEAQND